MIDIPWLLRASIPTQQPEGGWLKRKMAMLKFNPKLEDINNASAT